ncbi:P-loop containing nucleoside triphosphate hydrolase protein [Colletotrichum godetiae]|uniref:P-loop containing nucleoside triphosphate hydrolase protein n=1 Tax=Colletotrichum godetiae TaxID=1209918 RepID=A0AAJ0ERJ3_9PEZI|nr:P-loop containing nucleoside triphosphate hydrolase protein [Colletotrichum godetiae]KAK1671408.1 P-loop containing nucleoside triphosphate hydrolase protein [Colletotrichum godetiae]
MSLTSTMQHANRQRQPFCFEDDDDGPERSEVRPAIVRQAESDIFDESVEDMIEESRRDIPGSGRSPLPSYHGNDELDDLFVPSEEWAPNVEPSHAGDVPIKSEESDDDYDLMIIDQGEASSKARQEWVKPRGPWTIDLTPSSLVKKEPLANTHHISMAHNSKNEPGAEAFADGNTSFHDSDSFVKELEKRKVELQSKALKVALSLEDISELCQVIAQLNQAQDKVKVSDNALSAAPSTAANVDQESGECSGKKMKKISNPRIKSAADYWARQEEKDRIREETGQKRSRASQRSSRAIKRTSNSNNARAAGDDDNENKRIERQIEALLHPTDAIQERAEVGDLTTIPEIIATTRADQLKKMRESAPEYFEPQFLDRQKRELLEATKAWGPRAVRAKNGFWEVKGLQSLMHHHQLIVGAWMMGRELKGTPKRPRGGILADAMGLGKTIETHSCIVGNQASESLRQDGKGATLVVVPSGQMISQWMSEVKKHCDKKFAKDIIHFKVGNKMDIEQLSSFNMVFASYHQLRDSIPSSKERLEKPKEIVDPEKYNEWLQESTGVLHRIEWHRVVLDEAHAIKNYLTHTAFACFELNAKHRWAVSGTPLINAATGELEHRHQMTGGFSYLAEFFSYLKFIRCHGIEEFSDYEREYRKGNSGRLLHGAADFEPATTIPTHQYLTLSKEEMVIFRMMERCFRRKINRDLETGDATKQMRCYLVMLLRLRQASTHPFLLEGMMAEYFTQSDLEATRKQLEELKGGSTVYNQIGSWTRRHQIASERIRDVIEQTYRLSQQQLLDDSKELLDAHNSQTIEPDHGNATSRSHPQPGQPNAGEGPITIADDSDEVDSQDEVEEDEDGLVPERFLPPRAQPEHAASSNVEAEEPRLQPFGCSDFGLAFDMSKQLEYLEKVMEIKKAQCVVCRKRSPEIPVKGRPLTPFDEDEDAESAAKTPNDKEYEKGFDCTGFQHTEDDKDDKHAVRFLQVADRYPHLPLTPSAKLTALKETVLTWQAEASDDKIIIFSQFNVVMKIVGRMLEAEGIDFAYLSGSQTTEQRNKAVDEFQNGDKIKVLIVSLRAGGQCLNLTRGNRVILIELWWNHAVEQQAFARVFRMGQIKETHFVRFIVDTPIEQRMLQLQASKILSIDAALQDDTARAPKISLQDIACLLGKVTMRDGLVTRVSADYDDDDDDDDDDGGGGDEEDDDDSEDENEEEGDLEGFVVPDDEDEEMESCRSAIRAQMGSLSDDSEEE